MYASQYCLYFHFSLYSHSCFDLTYTSINQSILHAPFLGCTTATFAWSASLLCGSQVFRCDWKQVTKVQLLECCDGDFLAAAGLVVNAAAWHKKNIRVNTKAVYQQYKFNLLREESEGFAKLVTVLNRVGAASLSDRSLPGLVQYPPSLLPLEPRVHDVA